MVLIFNFLCFINFGFKVRYMYCKIMDFFLIMIILILKASNQFYSWYWNSKMTAVVVPKNWLSPFVGHQQTNWQAKNTTINSYFIYHDMSKGYYYLHKSETGNNRGRQRTTTRDNQRFNCKGSHSKSNELSSLVIPMPPQLNNSVIDPPQLYSVHQ